MNVYPFQKVIKTSQITKVYYQLKLKCKLNLFHNPGNYHEKNTCNSNSQFERYNMLACLMSKRGLSELRVRVKF